MSDELHKSSKITLDIEAILKCKTMYEINELARIEILRYSKLTTKILQKQIEYMGEFTAEAVPENTGVLEGNTELEKIDTS